MSTEPKGYKEQAEEFAEEVNKSAWTAEFKELFNEVMPGNGYSDRTIEEIYAVGNTPAESVQDEIDGLHNN